MRGRSKVDSEGRLPCGADAVGAAESLTRRSTCERSNTARQKQVRCALPAWQVIALCGLRRSRGRACAVRVRL